MKTVILFTFICSVSLQLTAQNTLIWNERQPLQWNDFAGHVNDTSLFDAESFAEVKYSYLFNSPKDFHFDVYADFNKNISWCRSALRSSYLLKHEQLHFDIAALYAKKLQQAFDNYHYSENYQNEILEIFNQKKGEYHAMQHKYDTETNHSLSRERQLQWEKFISEELFDCKNLLFAIN